MQHSRDSVESTVDCALYKNKIWRGKIWIFLKNINYLKKFIHIFNINIFKE